MEMRELAEQAVAVGGGASVVGGAVIWMFREKIGVWVDTRVDVKLTPLIESQAHTEERMEKLEHESTVTVETVKNLAVNIEGHMARQTQTLTTLTLELVQQGKQMAEIRGEMNARRD